MENSEEIMRIVGPPRRPRLPLCPERQRGYQIFKDLGKNNPELLKSELAKMKEARKPKPIDPEIRKMRRAAAFERTGPVTYLFRPGTIRDTSEAACDTKYQADTYKKLANADPRQVLFKVMNPATGLPDEVFTACVLKRYRKDQSDSSVTVVAASDDVQGTSVLKRHREEIGESSETMVTASGIADEVLPAASVLKRHHMDLGESSETVVPARDNN